MGDSVGHFRNYKLHSYVHRVFVNKVSLHISMGHLLYRMSFLRHIFYLGNIGAVLNDKTLISYFFR